MNKTTISRLSALAFGAWLALGAAACGDMGGSGGGMGCGPSATEPPPADCKNGQYEDRPGHCATMTKNQRNQVQGGTGSGHGSSTSNHSSNMP